MELVTVLHQSERWFGSEAVPVGMGQAIQVLLTPLLFLLPHFLVQLCTACLLVATQTRSGREFIVLEVRHGGGKQGVATPSYIFVKTPLSLQTQSPPTRSSSFPSAVTKTALAAFPESDSEPAKCICADGLNQN